MRNYHEILLPGHYFHVYNRSNGDDMLFKANTDYSFFIKKFKQYICPIAETLSYCLLPDHFHFLIRINNEQHILNAMENNALGRKSRVALGLSPVRVSNEPPDIQRLRRHPDRAHKETILSHYLSNQFSRFFNAYTQSYNKTFNRHGSLLQRPFNRTQINDEKYLMKLTHYIHYNPVKAHLCKKPEEWQFSSYNAIVSNKKTMINKKEVINWFGDLDNFMYCHHHQPELTGIDQF